MSYERCPRENPECIYYQRSVKAPGASSGCFADTHHQWWPSPEYRTKTEKDFRNLACFKELICRAIHDEIHANPPPDKPSYPDMREYIEEFKQ